MALPALIFTNSEAVWSIAFCINSLASSKYNSISSMSLVRFIQ